MLNLGKLNIQVACKNITNYNYKCMFVVSKFHHGSRHNNLLSAKYFKTNYFKIRQNFQIFSRSIVRNKHNLYAKKKKKIICNSEIVVMTNIYNKAHL